MKKYLKALIVFSVSCLLFSNLCWADGVPSLQAMINHNWVSGNDFPSEINVDVTINGGDIAAFSTSTDSSGWFTADGWQYWPDQWIARGDIIEVSYEDQTVAMTVQDINAEVELENNLIIGTAFSPEGLPLEGRMVEVGISEEWGSPALHHYENIVNEYGVFVLGGDPNEFEIQKGYKLFLSLHDDPDGYPAGHMTSMEPYNGIPWLLISSDHNFINGHDFPFNSLVNLSVNANPEMTGIVISDLNGHFWKDVHEYDGYQLLPGDVIQAEYGSDEFVSATVPDVIVSADPFTDIISGTALGFAGQSVWIDIFSQNYEELLHQENVPVDLNGDFFLEWFDLEPGYVICVFFIDAQNNQFVYHPYNPIPTIEAMINHNWVSGNGFPLETQVDITINGGAVAAFSILTDSNGHFFADGWQYWPDQWIARGDIIEVSYGDQTVAMAVQNINAEVELENNRIVGTAFTPEGVPLEGRRVEVRIHEHEDWGPMLHHYESLVDEFGGFALGGDPEEFEIQKGYKLFLAVHESPDGNYTGHMTSMEPYNGIPRLEISPDDNWINGHYFPFNSNVYISLNDDINLTAIVTSDWSGFFWKDVWEIDGYQLQPGDVIHAEYAAGEFVSATIPDNAITISTDLETNTISGMAVGFEGQNVRIDIYSQNYEELLHQVDVPVGQDGLYSLEWTGLEPGQEICVVGKDSQNNEFKYHHNIPIWSITGGFLQYGTFEDEDRNRYQSYIDIQKNGQPVQEHELVASTFKDPDGNELYYLHRGFYYAQHNFFDCRTGDCTEHGPIINSGFWAIYENELVAGTYESELEMYDGQILSSMPYYPGPLSLPVVSSSSMTSGYENGDLIFSWINPVSQENWDAVDELRVVLFDNWGQEILYIALNKTDDLEQAITIPTNVLENAEDLHGTYFAEWQVQTRAYSDHGMNYARGNSNNKPHGVRIDYVQLYFRTHENEALDVYRGLIAVSKNGLPVEENEINVVLFLDPDGNEIEALNDFFWSGEYIFYNCTTGDCIASGPHVESSFYSHFEGELSEGVYQFIIGTADGQFRSVERYYPGKLVLPVVSSSSMASGYENGDLVLNWTNPVGHQNWDEVDQLRLVFLDNMGNDILYVTPVKTNEPEQAITIPGHVLDNAEAIHGTVIVEWEVQTRSFSDDWMNYARGISNRILIDSWEEGSGTPEDPYLVREPQHLSMMRDYLSSYFRLENHIDMDGSPDWVPVGTIEAPFIGGFDGNGYTVRNLFMNSSNTDYAGLFGYVQDAVITNTGLEDIDIRGGNHVGALAGYAQNTSVMECYATGFVSGLDNVGGLAGTLETDTSSLIFNSYADCDLDGGAAVGGIVGTLGASAAIENTYAVGSVQGNSDIGGLVGVNNNATHDNVVNSFWDTNIGPATSQGGTGKTTAEMMKHATYTGWDFVETWVIYESRTYPYLQWQPMPLLAFYPNLINWNGNLVADFGENGLWYHNGTSWTWMTNKGHVSQMVVWDGKLVVDFGADHGLHCYDGTWNWMSNKGDVALMLSWNDGTDEKIVVDFGDGRRIYTYDGSWHWFNNKDAVADMTVWNNKLVVDFGNGRSVFHHDGTSWTWMTNKDDVAMMLPWHAGTEEKLVVDFGDGRRMYTYDGAWQWFNNKDDVNAMAVWNNKLVVDFGNSRGMYNYDGTWNWMTNKDDVTRFVPWHDGTADKLAVDFGGGRGMHYYDGTWNWMKNTDDVPEMIAWGNRLAVDFGSGVGIYNYDGTWNWMRNWSTRD